MSQVTKNVINECSVELLVCVPISDVEVYLEKAANKLSQDLKIEGFRPGKVPYNVMKAQVGELAVLEEAAREIINRNAGKIIETEVGQRMIGKPEINISKLAPGNDLEYKITLEVLPAVVLSNYKGFDIAQEKTELSDEEVEKSLNELRDMRVSEVLVDRPAQAGDKVTADIKMFLDNVPLDGGQAKGVTIIIGKDYVVPGFDKELIGMTKGANKEFTLPYPADHHQKNLAGKKVEFNVTINDVFARIAPEMNDDFAVKLGLKDIDDLKGKIKESLLADKQRKADEKLEISILEQLVESNPIADLPQSLIDNEAHQMVHELEHNVAHMGGKFDDYLSSINKTHDGLVEEFKVEAAKRIKVALLMKELAVKEKMEVTEADIDNELEALKGHYQGQQDALDYISKPEFRKELRGRLLNRQIIEKLKEWNVVK